MNFWPNSQKNILPTNSMWFSSHWNWCTARRVTWWLPESVYKKRVNGITVNPLMCLVPRTRIELVRGCPRGILSPLRLPVPPPRRGAQIKRRCTISPRKNQQPSAKPFVSRRLFNTLFSRAPKNAAPDRLTHQDFLFARHRRPTPPSGRDDLRNHRDRTIAPRPGGERWRPAPLFE